VIEKVYSLESIFGYESYDIKIVSQKLCSNRVIVGQSLVLTKQINKPYNFKLREYIFMGFYHWDEQPISVINKMPQSHYSYSYFALHFKYHLWYHFTVRLLAKWWHSLAYCDFTAYAATSHPVVSSWALTSFVWVCSALQIFYVLICPISPLNAWLRLFICELHVYDYITAAVILYVPASRKLLQSSELYCAISFWNSYCHCFRTWLDSDADHLKAQQSLPNVCFTTHIDIEMYLECGISLFSSA